MKMNMKMMAAVVLMGAAVSCTQMNPSREATIPDARVVLGQNNFRVLSTQVSAEDSGFSLIPGLKAFAGVAGSFVPGVDSTKIPQGIEIVSPSESKALEKLYKASGASNTGRATQLINLRTEKGGLNAIIFGRPTVRVTADLIEFVN